MDGTTDVSELRPARKLTVWHDYRIISLFSSLCIGICIFGMVVGFVSESDQNRDLWGVLSVIFLFAQCLLHMIDKFTRDRLSILPASLLQSARPVALIRTYYFGYFLDILSTLLTLIAAFYHTFPDIVLAIWWYIYLMCAWYNTNEIRTYFIRSVDDIDMCHDTECPFYQFEVKKHKKHKNSNITADNNVPVNQVSNFPKPHKILDSGGQNNNVFEIESDINTSTISSNFKVLNRYSSTVSNSKISKMNSLFDREHTDNIRQVMISGKEYERIVYCDDRHYHFNPRRHTLTSLDGIKAWTGIIVSFFAIWVVLVAHTIILSNVYSTQYHYYYNQEFKQLITYFVLTGLTFLHGISMCLQLFALSRKQPSRSKNKSQSKKSQNTIDTNGDGSEDTLNENEQLLQSSVKPITTVDAMSMSENEQQINVENIGNEQHSHNNNNTKQQNTKTRNAEDDDSNIINIEKIHATKQLIPTLIDHEHDHDHEHDANMSLVSNSTTLNAEPVSTPELMAHHQPTGAISSDDHSHSHNEYTSIATKKQTNNNNSSNSRNINNTTSKTISNQIEHGSLQVARRRRDRFDSVASGASESSISIQHSSESGGDGILYNATNEDIRREIKKRAKKRRTKSQSDLYSAILVGEKQEYLEELDSENQGIFGRGRRRPWYCYYCCCCCWCCFGTFGDCFIQLLRIIASPLGVRILIVLNSFLSLYIFYRGSINQNDSLGIFHSLFVGIEWGGTRYAMLCYILSSTLSFVSLLFCIRFIVHIYYIRQTGRLSYYHKDIAGVGIDNSIILESRVSDNMTNMTNMTRVIGGPDINSGRKKNDRKEFQLGNNVLNNIYGSADVDLFEQSFTGTATMTGTYDPGAIYITETNTFHQAASPYKEKFNFYSFLSKKTSNKTSGGGTIGTSNTNRNRDTNDMDVGSLQHASLTHKIYNSATFTHQQRNRNRQNRRESLSDSENMNLNINTPNMDIIPREIEETEATEAETETRDFTKRKRTLSSSLQQIFESLDPTKEKEHNYSNKDSLYAAASHHDNRNINGNNNNNHINSDNSDDKSDREYNDEDSYGHSRRGRTESIDSYANDAYLHSSFNNNNIHHHHGDFNQSPIRKHSSDHDQNNTHTTIAQLKTEQENRKKLHAIGRNVLLRGDTGDSYSKFSATNTNTKTQTQMMIIEREREKEKARERARARQRQRRRDNGKEMLKIVHFFYRLPYDKHFRMSSVLVSIVVILQAFLLSPKILTSTHRFMMLISVLINVLIIGVITYSKSFLLCWKFQNNLRSHLHMPEIFLLSYIVGWLFTIIAAVYLVFRIYLINSNYDDTNSNNHDSNSNGYKDNCQYYECFNSIVWLASWWPLSVCINNEHARFLDRYRSQSSTNIPSSWITIAKHAAGPMPCCGDILAMNFAWINSADGARPFVPIFFMQLLFSVEIGVIQFDSCMSLARVVVCFIMVALVAIRGLTLIISM